MMAAIRRDATPASVAAFHESCLFTRAIALFVLDTGFGPIK
jgi:hypothetical protein